MGKVKSVIPGGIIEGTGKRVVMADSGQRIAPKTHDVKSSKVVVANVDMPQMSETKGKVVKVLY
jgi:hypothetical protein